MSHGATCIECGQKSPEPSKEQTLISGFGWRVRRSAEGKHEWRCPRCWKLFRARSPQAAAGVPDPETPPKDRE